MSDVFCPMFAVRHLISNMYDVCCQTSDVPTCQTSDFLVWCLMSDVWYLIYIWCLMSEVRRLMSDVRRLVSRSQISGVWCVICLVADARRLITDVCCQQMWDVWFLLCLMSDVWCLICLVSDVRCQTSNVWQMSDVRCQMSVSDFRHLMCNICSLSLLGVLSWSIVRANLSVTSQLMVESRNYQGQNAWELGCDICMISDVRQLVSDICLYHIKWALDFDNLTEK